MFERFEGMDLPSIVGPLLFGAAFVAAVMGAMSGSLGTRRRRPAATSMLSIPYSAAPKFSHPSTFHQAAPVGFSQPAGVPRWGATTGTSLHARASFPRAWQLDQRHGRRRAVSTVSAAAVSGTSGHSEDPLPLNFLEAADVEAIRAKYGSPAYVYDLASLRTQARKALAFPNAFGLTVRFAMKASPNAAILQTLSREGLHIDASSVHEVDRAMRAGIPPHHISLSSQELPAAAVPRLLELGVKINACSLEQVRTVGKAAATPGQEVGLRFNPGLGSGGTTKTNVGGPSSSFGIWHGLMDEVEAEVVAHGLKVVKIHTHIGSGSDPAVWQRVSAMSLALTERFPDVHTLNLGGGFKVARMPDEKSTDLAVCGEPVKQAFERHAAETGRKLRLEIEPGTFLLANSASLVGSVQDIVTTRPGDETPPLVASASDATAAASPAPGFDFIKLDAGMTDVLRPSLYGSQHPLVVVPSPDAGPRGVKKYVVVGHCCESGDLLTPAPDAPEVITERVLTEAAVGDALVVEGVGAYCSAMATTNYNSFLQAPEVMFDGEASNPERRYMLIRRRQTLDQILQNEIEMPADVLGDPIASAQAGAASAAGSGKPTSAYSMLPPEPIGIALREDAQVKGGPKVEIYLDLCCPFSRKMFGTVSTVAQLRRGVDFIVHPTPQPVHEVLLAVKTVAPENAVAFMAAIFDQWETLVTDVATFDQSRADLHARLADVAEQAAGVPSAKLLPLLAYDNGGDLSAVNNGNAVTQSLKWAVKLHRKQGVHVTPTVFVNGIEAPVSSGWSEDEWLDLIDHFNKGN